MQMIRLGQYQIKDYHYKTLYRLRNIQMSSKKRCKICLNKFTNMYSICSCPHKYCLQCCLNHLKYKAQSFAQIKCPFQQCEKPYNIYCFPHQQSPDKIKRAISKFQNYKFTSQNFLRQCTRKNCTGYFSIEASGSNRCDQCDLAYCQQCLSIQHQGDCDLFFDKKMNIRGFKRCRKCLMMTEKIDGCNYVRCKCGSSYCFQCGQLYQNDLCRDRQVESAKQRLTELVSNFEFIPYQPLSIKFLPSLILTVYKLLAIIISSILLWVVSVFVSLLFWLFAFPFIPIQYIQKQISYSSKIKKKTFFKKASYFLYPLLFPFGMLHVVMSIIGFKFFKNIYSWSLGLLDFVRESRIHLLNANLQIIYWIMKNF